MMKMKSLKTTLAALALVAVAAPAQAEGELFIYNWSNYIPPDLLKRFEAETGIDVTLDVYDSNETMLGKLQAGATGYDIIVPSDYIVPRLIEEEIIQPINTMDMENAGNIRPAFQSPYYDTELAYTAPYMWGTTGFSYDADRVPGGKLDDSWASFFQPPEELKGQVVALNDVSEVYTAAAYYLGYERCTESATEAQEILNLMLAQKPYLAMYQSDGTIERMIAGEVIMHQQWNGAAHRTKKERPSVVFVYPREGVPYWADNLAVPTGARNPDSAKVFINWMMEPKNAAEVSNYTGYMNAIDGSGEFLDDVLKADPAVNTPPEYQDRLRANTPCSAKAIDLRDKVWTKLKK